MTTSFLRKGIARVIVLLAVLLLVPGIAFALNTPKTVIAKVTKDDGTFHANAGITIKVTDGHSETVTYPDGLLGGKTVITYSETNGLINLTMANFTAQWVTGDTLTIEVSGSGETGSTTTTLNANSLQAFTTDANLSFKTAPAANTPPVATDGTLTTTEDTAANGTLAATDADSDALTFSIVTNGTKGSAVITDTATGAYTYTPTAGQTGTDTFTFKANDGTADSNTATVTVTINPAANTAPVAQDGTLAVTEDTAANGTLVATDADSDPLTYSIVTNGTKGTAAITDAATGAYTYTPNANATGTDTFTFKANDGQADSNTATVTVTITGTNDAPVAQDGTLTTTVNTAANGTLVATDVDGDALTYSIVTNGTKGTAVITDAATGAYTYTPTAGQTGTDTFTFKANDGTGDSNTATVTVTINAGNTPPVATDGTLTTAQDTAANGTLVATDADSDALTYSIVTNGTKGTAVITDAATGAYTYTPTAGQTGTDTFTFKANDGTADSNVATITVTITPAGPLKGDADDDGEVTIFDALEVARYVVTPGYVINMDNADVDCSGDVDINDALMIAEYDALLIANFPACTK